MRHRVLLFSGLLLIAACGNDHYTPEDFKNVRKVDAHIHLSSDNTILADLAKEDNFFLLTINVDAGIPIDDQEKFAWSQVRFAPQQVKYLATFSMKNWADSLWSDSTVARLKNSFEHGALGIKIWKNIGIVERDSAGNFIQVDDPRFDEVVQFVIDNDKTILGHLGEPKNCWLPLEEMTVNNDRSYFKEHPEYHMYLHPEYPSYEEVIEARDRFLEKHPDLRFVGAHLGSLEWNLDELGKRLDKFPNMAVDMAARIPHLQYLTQRDRESVRKFFDKYQDRIIYATDLGIRPDSDPEEKRKQLHDAWLEDWKYFVTDEKMSSPFVNGEFQGLKLEKKIIDKIYRENALRWFKIPQ
ncbi:MAG TPA: amidohydrolase family protein [Cyclobacteriaceae bacterium]|nr:amidohydrolase family protein [Cyclobacteriaceae bacterium]